VRTHAEHLAHMLNPVPLFERVGHCVPVGTDGKILKAAYTRINFKKNKNKHKQAKVYEQVLIHDYHI